MARTCQRCSHENEDHAKFCLSCGAMLEVDDGDAGGDPLIGKLLLGRYRALSVLGEGGMGKVYLSEQQMGTATRKVAIKTLHPELGNDPQLVARFHRESETVIELRHPNTIQFYDFGELEDGTLIIVMEYIKGKPLADVLEADGFVDPARADKIIIQVCGSLYEAHQRGIVHRDLKPENVLLTDQGGQKDFVKVLDFGIAKKDDAEDPAAAKLTKQGMVLGTPPYMSPEQFSGQPLDARSDVYSLGIMAYEMLTGSLPFKAATPWEWATKHLTAEPTPLEAHARGQGLPAHKKQAVMRALAKNRDERPTTVQDFLKEFTGLADADSAWTMATSTGGMHQAPGQPRGPAPTPGPMPQSGAFGAAMTPPPGHGPAGFTHTAPGQAAYSQPGYGQPGHSAPGYSAPGYSQPGHSAPGYSQPGHGAAGYSQPGHSAPGYGQGSYPGATGAHSQHGYGGQGQHGAGGYPSDPSMAGYSSPGYGTGSQSAAKSGGGMGKVLAAGAVFLLMLFGAGGGLAWWANQDDDEPDVPPATTATNTGAVVTAPDPSNPPMVPTTPTPMQPGLQPPIAPTPPTPTPPTPTPPTPTPPTTPEPTTPTTPEPTRTPDRPNPPSRRGPSPAQESQARALVATGMAAARRNDFAGGIAALSQAQRLVGRNSPIQQELQNELTTRGGNQVGILLTQGNCAAAQQLNRQLATVRANRQSRRQFGGWCNVR